MKKLLLVAMLSTALTSPALAAQETKYLVVDINRVIGTSNAMNQVNKEVEEYRVKNAKEFEKKEQELRAEDENLKKEEATLAPDAFQKKVREFRTKFAEVGRSATAKREQMDKAFNTALTQLNTEAEKIIQDIAKENGAEIIFASHQLLYANENLNMSEEMLKRLNAKVSKIKIDLK